MLYNSKHSFCGTYNYTITDSNNCIYTNSVILTEPSPISTIEIVNDASCFGYSDGNVSLVISGGIPIIMKMRAIIH